MSEQQEEKVEVKIPHNIKLRKPIKIGADGEMLEILTITREPNAGDFADFDTAKIKFGDMLHILSKITGQPRKSVIDKLGTKDMFEGIEVLNGFLPSSQKIGEEA